jgi:hypothetical protein
MPFGRTAGKQAHQHTYHWGQQIFSHGVLLSSLMVQASGPCLKAVRRLKNVLRNQGHATGLRPRPPYSRFHTLCHWRGQDVLLSSGQEAMGSRYHPMFHLRGFVLRKSSCVIQRKGCRTASRRGDGNPDHLVAWSLGAVLK